jgi:hypothetical protein
MSRGTRCLKGGTHEETLHPWNHGDKGKDIDCKGFQRTRPIVLDNECTLDCADQK